MPQPSSIVIARRLAGSLALACASLASLAAPAPSAQEILQRSDWIRFPEQSFQVGISISTSSPGQQESVSTYRVLVKGTQRSLVQTLSPANQKGQILLMKGSDLWVFLPRVSQPVRLPLSQRLTGQVANGDLARVNFVGDYEATLDRIDTVDGTDYYVLELTAARRGVTYHRVRYWVEKERYRPFKAEFYSKSNRLLKVGHYQAYREMAGAMRPSQLVLEDAMSANTRSVLEYRDMTLRDLPDRYFTKQFLKKLR